VLRMGTLTSKTNCRLVRNWWKPSTGKSGALPTGRAAALVVRLSAVAKRALARLERAEFTVGNS
jgi:hypothetical protein